MVATVTAAEDPSPEPTGKVKPKSKPRRPAKQAPTIHKGKKGREREAYLQQAAWAIKCFHVCTRKAKGQSSQELTEDMKPRERKTPAPGLVKSGAGRRAPTCY